MEKSTVLTEMERRKKSLQDSPKEINKKDAAAFQAGFNSNPALDYIKKMILGDQKKKDNK